MGKSVFFLPAVFELGCFFLLLSFHALLTAVTLIQMSVSCVFVQVFILRVLDSECD